MSDQIITVAIVEDDDEMRDHLATTILRDPRMTLRGSYRSAGEALSFIRPKIVEIAVVDIGLPDKSGIECVRQLKERDPDLQCLMFTVFDYDSMIYESLMSGANGYLLKTLDADKIIRAILELAEKGAPMSPSIARKVLDYFARIGGALPSNAHNLTARESEILNLLAKGLLYKEIGDQLGIKTGTVKQTIHRMYKKMHVQNRSEAIRKYLTGRS